MVIDWFCQHDIITCQPVTISKLDIDKINKDNFVLVIPSGTKDQ